MATRKTAKRHEYVAPAEKKKKEPPAKTYEDGYTQAMKDMVARASALYEGTSTLPRMRVLYAEMMSLASVSPPSTDDDYIATDSNSSVEGDDR